MIQPKLAEGIFQKTGSNLGSPIMLAILAATVFLSLGGCQDPSIEVVHDSQASTHVDAQPAEATHLTDENSVAEYSGDEHGPRGYAAAGHTGGERGQAEHSAAEHSGPDGHAIAGHAEVTHLPDPSDIAAEVQDTPGAADQTHESEPGVLGKAGSLLKQATAKGGATAKGASQWVQDKLGSAADAGGQTAEETMDWANETFEMLKAKGLTTASSTTQWLGEDWSNMESWEYKVVTLGDTDEGLTNTLNDLGKQGWECFETETKPGGTRFLFKRPTFSYLRHLPFKDVIKLAPLMNNGGK